MKLKDQVCGLELAKKLKELGVKQKSEFHWILTWGSWEIRHWAITSEGDEYAAFTVAELGELLPSYGQDDKYWKLPWRVKDSYGFKWYSEADNRGAHTEVDARAILLINLIENELIQL